MEKTLKELLEGLLNTLDPSKEVIAESVREDMTTRFVEAVQEAVKAETGTIDEAIALQMELIAAQITESKKAHATEISDLNESFESRVDALDEQFSSMLEFAIGQFDERSVAELTKVKEAFDVYIEKEMDDLCESVETIIENRLDEANTEEDVAGLAKLEKYEKAFEAMRTIFYTDTVLEQKVTESVGGMKTEFDKVLSQNIILTKKLNKIEVDTFIESETDAMKPSLKDYMVERFENGKITDVKENWESAQEDFKLLDEENRRLAKESIEDLNINHKLDEDEDEDEEAKSPVNEAYARSASAYAKMI